VLYVAPLAHIVIPFFIKNILYNSIKMKVYKELRNAILIEKESSMTDLIEILAIGLVGAISAIAGILISRFFEYQDRRSEEKRWYAQYFLGLKIDALKKLQITLEKGYFTFQKYGNIGPLTYDEFNTEIQPIQESFRVAIRFAVIYLTNEEKQIFEDVLGEFRQIEYAIRKCIPRWETEPPKDTSNILRPIPNVENWDTFMKNYNRAVDCIGQLLNPKNLRDYIKNI